MGSNEEGKPTNSDKPSQAAAPVSNENQWFSHRFVFSQSLIFVVVLCISTGAE